MSRSNGRSRAKKSVMSGALVLVLVVSGLLLQVSPASSLCYIECYTTTGSYSTTTITSTSSSTLPAGWTVPLPNKVPKGLFAYVPIVLVNTQTASTKAGFDQLVVVNSSNFAPFEASGLQNVEFFTSSGAVITSWLESGNSNTSASTVYWLKSPKAIPALANLTIYMGFAPLNVSLFGPKKVGEAPQLSPVYGQFDNGKSVFKFYDNFANGTASSKWAVNATGGTLTRNNQLILTFGATPGFYATSMKAGLGTSFDALVSSFGPSDTLGYMDTKPALHNSGNGNPDWAGAFIRSQCGNVFPDQFNSSREANNCGSILGTFTNSPSAHGVFSVAELSSSSTVQSINYSVGVTTQPLTTGSPTFPARAGFSGQGGSVSAQWVRVRALPPNDIMPTVTFEYPHAIPVISKGASVSTNPLFFFPATLTITVDTKVTWKNLDATYHTVTSDANLFDSGPIPPKGLFSFNFTQPGTYAYHCAIHPWMHGTIVVVKP